MFDLVNEGQAHSRYVFMHKLTCEHVTAFMFDERYGSRFNRFEETQRKYKSLTRKRKVN